jgi:DNA polymerase-3 subunit alpha
VLDTCGAYLRENQTVVVKGRLSVRDEKAPQIMCDSVYPLSSVESGGLQQSEPQTSGDKIQEGTTLFLKFPSIDHPSVRHMKLVFNMFPGTTQVKMVMADTRKVYATQTQLHQALIAEAKEVLGEENVVIR